MVCWYFELNVLRLKSYGKTKAFEKYVFCHKEKGYRGKCQKDIEVNFDFDFQKNLFSYF